MRIYVERKTTGGGGGGSAFTTIQPDAGTAPVATTAADTLTLTSSDGSVTITGDSSTDTIDFAAAVGIENPADVSWKYRREDFNLQSGNNYYGTLNFLGGTIGGSFIQHALVTGEERLSGVLDVNGGTNYALMGQGTSSNRFGDGDHRVGAYGKHLNTPDATDDFIWWVGFNLSFNSLGTYNAIILIDRTVSTTNYIARTRRASTDTDIDTGVAIDTNWHTFEVIVNDDLTSITFYIDATLVGTSTTNLPNASMAVQFMQKFVAGAARHFYIDYIYHAFKPATARGTLHTWITN